MAHREELDIFVIVSNDHNDLGLAMHATPETSKAACDVCLSCPERLPHIPFPLYNLFAWLWRNFASLLSSIVLLRDGRTQDGLDILLPLLANQV